MTQQPTVETQPSPEAIQADAYQDAVARRLDVWLPANGGTETPCTYRSGARLLYCWNPATAQHAYLDCGTDMILSDEDAMRLTGVGL